MAPNSNNLNGLARVYGKNSAVRGVNPNSYRDGYGRSLPPDQNRGYMNNHLTPAQLRLNAERDNLSY